MKEDLLRLVRNRIKRAEFEEVFRFGASNLTDYAVEIRYGEKFYFPTLEESKRSN